MRELTTLDPKIKDLGGGLLVRRLLPAMQARSVGPFVFFDHFGPIVETPGDDHDVRPHPHIGLATVTYLFDGAMMHRDSLGKVQRIEPGAINWMTAGSGIAHSERTPEDLRGATRPLHGLQLWCALPVEREEGEPTFRHTDASAIPAIDIAGASVRVLVGAAFGAESAVQTLSPTLYLDIALAPGASLEIPPAHERALYGIDKPYRIDGTQVEPLTMVVLPEGSTPRIEAAGGARVVLIGGEPLGPRFIWWNFVHSRKERIVQAADDWEAGRFAAIPGESEFIPLPPRKF